MLEIRNLTKIYKSKKSEDVKALDNVSLSFNRTGMVFLLGKSGSGKSTLLNVLGGLDKFDSGEIIIDGKSSKDFKESDFDSYRNTFLGFIFQEYNILSEFTVYKNIEFALELQGKKPKKDEVNDLLEQVDLKGYGKRKPNELSGGQKQRIAIARALIKNPQIIMADEPTGALDSNTGKQVFDTLKKLSQEKLVIVVSHDREFAEIYADRIIELKDGKIISDTTKRFRTPDKINEGFNLVDDHIIHIEKGHKYTKEEIEKLNSFLKNADGDIILTSDQNLNKNVRQIAKIDDKGNREYFDSTAETDLEKRSEKDNLKLIKSKLKFKDSFKMGASGLKTKKVRLFFTILLSAIALTLFGLADTMASYNVKRSNYESLMSLGVDTLSINTRHIVRYEDDDYSYSEERNAGAADLAELKAKFPNHSFKEIYSADLSLSYMTSKDITNYNYYDSSLNGITTLTTTEMTNFGLKFVSGTSSSLPSKSGEIVITTYHLDLLKEYGLEDKDGEKYEITDANQVIGKTVKFYDYTTGKYIEATIVGVIDTNLDLSKYEELKKTSDRNMDTSMYTLARELRTKINLAFNNVFVLYPADLADLTSTEDVVRSERGYFSIIDLDERSGGSSYSYFSMKGAEKVQEENVIFFDPAKTTLADDEVLIGTSVYISANSYNDDFYISYSSYDQTYSFKGNYNLSKQSLISEVQAKYRTEFYNNYGYVLPLAFSGSGPQTQSNLKVVGFYYDFTPTSNDYYSNDKSALYFKNEECVPKDQRIMFNQYSCIVTKLTGEKSSDYDLITYLSDYESEDDCLVIRSEISPTLEDFIDMIKMMAKIFLYVGIGFAVFSALLLMNFIGVSISYKKKEIGILRALGARGSDVYGIFFNESLIITVINFIVALALTIGGCILINNLVVGGLGISIRLLNFGIRQVGLLAAVSLVVAVIASFLPTNKISRMKPIDAILDRKQK